MPKEQMGKLLTWIFFLAGLISNVLIFAYFFIIKASFGLMNLQPIWMYPVLILLMSTIALIINGLMMITKQLGSKKSSVKKKTKYLLIFVGIINFLLFGLFVNIIWSLTHEKPPQFFPFNDPEATYTITKHGDNFMLKYESTGDMNSHQVCDRKNGKTNCHTEINRNIEVMIGKSEDELEPLLGKQVTVNGDFVYSDQQCIAEQCHHIGGWAVLNIEKIEEIAN